MVLRIHMHTQSLLLLSFPLSFLYKEKLFFYFFSFVSVWDDGCPLKSLWSSFHGICKLNHYAVCLKTSSVLYPNYISIKLGGRNILIINYRIIYWKRSRGKNPDAIWFHRERNLNSDASTQHIFVERDLTSLNLNFFLFKVIHLFPGLFGMRLYKFPHAIPAYNRCLRKVTSSEAPSVDSHDLHLSIKVVTLPGIKYFFLNIHILLRYA